MSGYWGSCPREIGDGFEERALDFKGPKGQPWFEIHLGPRDEFALFAGNTPNHLEHDTDLNLLHSYHFADVPPVHGAREWTPKDIGVRLIVSAIPAGEPQCYSFYIQLQKDPPPTWVQR